MIRSSSIVLGIALAMFVVLASPDSAEGQRRNRSNSDGSNNNEGNDNPGNAGGNNRGDNERGNRRNRNRGNNDNDRVQEIQQLFQGGQGGQNDQGGQGNRQQPRRRGQQGGQQLNDAQNIQQHLHDGQNRQNNNRQGRRFNHHNHNDLERWVVGFNGGPRPFSNDWYRHHPHAWHHHHHDNDYWKFATAASVVGWLGWQNHAHHHHTTIVYDPVPVESYVVDGQPGIGVDSSARGEWLALGSYTLLTGADDPGTRILDLSVDKHGHVRGSYFDMITNTTQNVYGVMNESTQQVRWTLETNRQLTFVATLDQLTHPQGVVNVKLPGGQIQQWDLVRMEHSGS